MSRARQRANGRFDAAYFAAGLVCFLVLFGAAISAGFGDAEADEAHGAVEVEGGDEASAPPSMDLERLTCFACHSMERYVDGGDGHYPHELHSEYLETVSTCHDCHRFEGHATPMRDEIEECLDCH